jgi:chromosome segregation ATPase
VKRLENLLAECQANLKKSDVEVLRLQTSLTEKGDEFEKVEALNNKLKRHKEDYEREQTKWVCGAVMSSFNSNIWCRMQT